MKPFPCSTTLFVAWKHLKIYLKTTPLHLCSVKTVPQSGFMLHRYSRLRETHSPKYVHVQKPLHDQPKLSEQIFWLGSVEHLQGEYYPHAKRLKEWSLID